MATSQGLVRLKHRASERQTREHMIELTSLREEVYEAAERAAQYIKEHYDSKTSTWKNEDLLKPGCKVWLEVRNLKFPADALMPTRKMRPRYMGPVTIVRRRRHCTFEVDLGNSRHHNVFHMSRFKPYYGESDGEVEGESIENFPVPDDTRPTSDEKAARRSGKTYVVERIVRRKGKKGKNGHQYLVKWKGYSPFHCSWEPASQVKAPAKVAEYEAELVRQREYLDGAIEDIDGSTDDYRLDPEAHTEVDAMVCGLMCPMSSDWLEWAASRWIDRNGHHFGD